MDWLRRNWPDLLIGLALIAVIAGIVATLLTGGSFFPLGGGTSPAATPSQPSVTAPADDLDDAPDAGTPDAGTPDAGSSDADSPDADVPSGDIPGQDGVAAAPGGDDDGPAVAVLPPSDSGDDPPGAPDPSVDEAPDVAAPDAADDASAGPVVPVAPDDEGQAPDLSEADAPAQPDAAAASGDAAAPAAAGASDAPEGADADLPTEPYRVSVGAFGLRENADAQADRFRDAGYPVFVAAQGSLALVLVGPYDDEAEARNVADEIRAGDFGIEPVIYEFRPDQDGADGADAAPGGTPSPVQEGAAPAAAAASEAEPDDAAEATETTSAPQTGASGTRLQVGAYADRTSAQPQIERLASLGFEPETLDEDGLVKLVVGPFAGAALSDARVVLEGADIPHFAR